LLQAQAWFAHFLTMFQSLDRRDATYLFS